jgi:hypothetical protein
MASRSGLPHRPVWWVNRLLCQNSEDGFSARGLGCLLRRPNAFRSKAEFITLRSERIRSRSPSTSAGFLDRALCH